MSFKLLAQGIPNFQKTFERFPDDDIFEAAELYNTVRSLNPSLKAIYPEKGIVEKTIANLGQEIGQSAAEDIGDRISGNPGLTDGLKAVGKIVFAKLLMTAVDLLSMRSSSSGGHIYVVAKKGGIIFDDIGFADFRFNGQEEPGLAFLRVVTKGLEKADMNSYGTLLAMSIVIAQFDAALADGATPKLYLTLTK